MPEEKLSPEPLSAPDRLSLGDGSCVAVLDGGPAGSFFSYFLLDMAQRVGLDVQVDINESRVLARPAPNGCNMCGGIVSESLVQHLATEGIILPPSVGNEESTPTSCTRSRSGALLAGPCSA